MTSTDASRDAIDPPLPRVRAALRKLVELPAAIGKYLDQREELHWQPRTFTASLPLRSMSAAERATLSEKLQRLRLGAAESEALPSLLAARCMLIEIAEVYRGSKLAPPSRLELALEFVHEGEPEDLIPALYEHQAALLHGVLDQCVDYPGAGATQACIDMLLAARKPSAGFGPPAPVKKPEQSDDLGYGFELMAPFERPIAEERKWVRRVAALHAERVRSATRERRRKDPAAIAVRGAHAKHHGLVRGKFVVRHDLPIELQHGVFRPGAVHDAWVRVSNMTERIQPDHQFDARGLAIKLIDVAEYGRRFDLGGANEALASSAVEQDFNLASPPKFFVKDVRDYAVVRSILNMRDKRALLRQLIGFGLRRPREAVNLVSSLLLRIEHPFAIPYHSISAYALGSAQAVKYSVRPLGEIHADLGLKSDNYLRERLQRSLDPQSGAAIRLEFCVIVPKPWARLSVEDARSDWMFLGRASCIPVATLEFEPQDPCSEERLRKAEQMVFTPWSTLEAHRPLGSLTRGRLSVYRASSDYRRAMNAQLAPAGSAESEPTQAAHPA
jgi:hypothetical protein